MNYKVVDENQKECFILVREESGEAEIKQYVADLKTVKKEKDLCFYNNEKMLRKNFKDFLIYHEYTAIKKEIINKEFVEYCIYRYIYKSDQLITKPVDHRTICDEKK